MPTVFQRVGPYEILHEIGRGGMAVVFLALDTRTDRRVALKLVPTSGDRDAHDILEAEHWGARLQQEFGRVSQHVPMVYEQATDGGYFYIAMEYLEGRNLSEVIGDGPLAPARAVGIGIQLCHFLEAAHAFEVTIEDRQLRSLLHGDLTPRNIRVLAGDQIKILDFGIAKALSLSRKVTRNDFGSLAYLSPERLESGDIDAHADFWAVGVLLYEMIAGVQPFRASDTRRLEQRIRSLQPPPALAAPCPKGVQAVVAKLLAPAPADRYRDAGAIRVDLERIEADLETVAQREGWPARAYDEPATRRTRPPAGDQEATRRTVVPPSVPPPPVPAPAVVVDVKTPAAPAKKKRRWLRTALLIFAIYIVARELSVAASANRVAAAVQKLELDDIGDTWREYEALKGQSTLGFAVAPLERALVRQTMTLADRVIENYRTPVPTVREAQWKMAREALADAMTVRPSDERLKASLRYCEGHLHRINGEARKARKQTDAQPEFTEAVSSFREAAELRSGWPDPFLGLMRTFIYGLEDVDRGADALKQAERLGYTAGDRETVQIADGYRARGDSLVRSANALTGMDQAREYLTRAADAYREALDLYEKAIGFADVPRTMRATQRSLNQVEERILNPDRDPNPF